MSWAAGFAAADTHVEICEGLTRIRIAPPLPLQPHVWCATSARRPMFPLWVFRHNPLAPWLPASISPFRERKLHPPYNFAGTPSSLAYGSATAGSSRVLRKRAAAKNEAVAETANPQSKQSLEAHKVKNTKGTRKRDKIRECSLFFLKKKTRSIITVLQRRILRHLRLALGWVLGLVLGQTSSLSTQMRLPSGIKDTRLLYRL